MLRDFGKKLDLFGKYSIMYLYMYIVLCWDYFRYRCVVRRYVVRWIGVVVFFIALL